MLFGNPPTVAARDQPTQPALRTPAGDGRGSSWHLLDVIGTTTEKMCICRQRVDWIMVVLEQEDRVEREPPEFKRLLTSNQIRTDRETCNSNCLQVKARKPEATTSPSGVSSRTYSNSQHFSIAF